MLITREVVNFETIRKAIFYRYPEIAELVEDTFGGGSGDDEAFEYALYLYLRALPDLNVTVDGWRTFYISQENQKFLKVVGLMYVLPDSELPMEVALRRMNSSTHYWLRIGIADSIWLSYSESKRWKLIYGFANGQCNEQWAWSHPIEGFVSDGTD